VLCGQVTNVTAQLSLKDITVVDGRMAVSDPPVNQTAYLSLGSNLGDRTANLRQAIRGLEQLGTISAVSSIYETEPVEVEGPQPWFLNCAVAVETDLTPQQFLARTLALEEAMGRRRENERKAARTVDIDIVLFGGAVVHRQGLEIPHPAMHRRRFVLEPLAEIAPDIRHPVFKRTVAELLAELPAGSGADRKFEAP
jgi:2-amino-4-hydroxy-6-hydroxymethyldihydropteridine diphosphokinase